MKKLLLFLSLLMLFCGFTSCDSSPEGDLGGDGTEAVLVGFSEYLECEGFTIGMTESDFEEVLCRYKYKSAPITELGIASRLDDDVRQGIIRQDTFFYYESDTRYVTPNEMSVMNIFYTTQALDGLVLPYGIGFDDSITDALGKLGLEFDPNSFAPDNADNKMMATLLTNETSSLVFNNFNLSEFDDYACAYELKFTEKIDMTGSSLTPTPTDVTREVTVWFDDNIVRLEIRVIERYLLG